MTPQPLPPLSDAVARRFAEFLRARGLRRTPEREAVLAVAMARNKLFSADYIADRLAESGLTITRATIYNNLATLEQAGFIRRLIFDGLPLHYEPSTVKSQAHLVCTSCGHVKVVRDPHIAALLNTRRYDAFTIKRTSLVYYGQCNTCARKRHRKSAVNKPTKTDKPR